MLVDEVKTLKSLDRFLYWIKERNQIRLKKDAGIEKPWTNDKILQTNYFTNVQREHDKVTIWFRENIRGPLRDKPEVVFATIAFRWFNWPLTGEALLKHNLFEEWDLDKALEILTAQKDAGLKVFTGAFNISNSGSTKPKVNRICEDHIQPVWKDRRRIIHCLESDEFDTGHRCTLKETFDILRTYPGFGGSGFMAAQVVCDLAYTYLLENATDWWAWCSWGPGSKRGMNRVLNLPEKHAMPKPEWHAKLEFLRGIILLRLGLKLHARDVQNCLCEFSKYERSLMENKRSKRRYRGL